LGKARIKPKDLNTQLLSQLWGDDKNLDPNERFLRNYVLSEAWLENNENKISKTMLRIDRDDDDKDSENDRFEHKKNFRFEEEGGANLTTYQRQINESYRIKDNSRKEKREERKVKKTDEKKKIISEIEEARNIHKEELKKENCTYRKK